MPESQATILEPTIYELLHKDELNKLFDLFKTETAAPFRIRSASVAGEMPSKRHDLNPNRHVEEKVDRSHSLACVHREFLETRVRFLNANTPQEEARLAKAIHKTNDMNDMDWRERLKSDETAGERSPSPKFSTHEIESPKIYVMGDTVFKKKLEKTLDSKAAKKKNPLNYYDVDEDINNLDHLKKPYHYVDSKLGEYLRPSKRQASGSASFSNSKPAKLAIRTHTISSTPYVFYRTPTNGFQQLHLRKQQQQQQTSANYLKLSKSLDSKIREDLRINRGLRL